MNHTHSFKSQREASLKMEHIVPLGFFQIRGWIQQYHGSTTHKVKHLWEQSILLHIVMNTCCFHQHGVHRKRAARRTNEIYLTELAN